MRIGLLGGSFNPPHAAHRAISLFALKRLEARSRLVAGDARATRSRTSRGLPPLDARIARRARGRRRSAHRHQLSRSCHRHPLHCRYDLAYLRSPLRFRRCTSSGSWERTTSRNSIVGKTGKAHCRRGADCRDRPSAAELSPRWPRRPHRPLAALPVYLRTSGRLCWPTMRTPAWVFLTGMKSSLSSTGLRNPDGTWK